MEDPNRHTKFTVGGLRSTDIEEEGVQILDLEIYESPKDVKHPWGHPKHFVQGLEGIVDEKALKEFKTHINPDSKDKVPQEKREAFFNDNVKPKILTELQKTKCFFRRKSQYDLGSHMPNCTDLSVEECKKEPATCEPNEITGITLIGDSFSQRPKKIEAEKWKKIEAALAHKDNDIQILRSKYRKSLVWSMDWFRANDGLDQVTGWHKEHSQPPMNTADYLRMKAETDLYYKGVLTTSQLKQGLPEIHLDTFVLPLKDYIEQGYGAQLYDGNYQGHTLNFWMPLERMTAAPLGFVSNKQDKFEVGRFEKVGSGWLFDTSFKKHTMISAIAGSASKDELIKNNQRQSLEFRFDLHFKNEPAAIQVIGEQKKPNVLKESSKQLFLGSDSE
jgi:hypothetical protein